jgi:hypothetical protein
MKQEGLMGDLREATQGVIELFPISGGSGEEYTFNSGGYVTKAYVNPVRSTDNRKKK